MSDEDFLKAINGDGLEIKTSAFGNYEMTTFKITNSVVVQGPKSNAYNYLVKNFNGFFLLLDIEALDGEHKGLKDQAAGGIRTKNGDIACYPATDKAPNGSFLFDIKEAIKAHDPKQLPEGWLKSFNAQFLIGKTFKMPAAHKDFGGQESFTLLTNYQKQADIKYAEKKAAENASQDNTAPAGTETDLAGDAKMPWEK